MNRVSIPRLHSVRPKDGAAVVHVLHNDGDGRHLSSVLQARARDFARDFDLVGYALVAWDREGYAVTSLYQAAAGNLPKLLVPDFVRKALELDIARRAAIDDREARG